MIDGSAMPTQYTYREILRVQMIVLQKVAYTDQDTLFPHLIRLIR